MSAPTPQTEAAEIAARHPHIRPAPVDWTRAAAEFGLSAVLWHGLADSALDHSNPDLGHMASDFGQRVSGLYRQLAQVAENYQRDALELARAVA